MAKDTKRKKMKILFVCYGNICRSPIAEGLVNHLHSDKVQAESAGVGASSGEPAAPDAVLIMKESYGIDISAHRARFIDDLDPSTFDYVIAMDSIVYNKLRRNNGIRSDVLYGWDISDPLGRGPFAYLEASQIIKKRVNQFFLNRGFI